jgi:uncharacterized protein
MADAKANPAPLGLACFGVTTVVLSVINAGLLGGDSLPVVVPLAFAFGGFAQMIAGAYEFKNGSTFGTVAFTAYGAFWWWFAILVWLIWAGHPPAAAGVGFTLLMWGVFTLYMWIPTFKTNFTLWAVFLFLWITFFALAGGDLGGGNPWKHLGGYLGILTGLLALYLSFAEVTNAVFGRTVVPIGGPLVKS